jgi:GxxExxY protein
MNTNVAILPRVNEKTVVHAELSYTIVAAAMEVLNTLGCGFLEKLYENALVVEFSARGLKVDQQRRFAVQYKNAVIGDYIPDLLVDEKVIIDTKVVDAIAEIHVAQMMNYLAITGLKLGILINFKHPRLEYRRVAR